MDKHDARAAARQEYERMQELDEQGLCQCCEEEPQNPYLSANLCLDCWNSQRPVGCMKSGCPNKAAGTLRQADFCEIHLADRLHGAVQALREQQKNVEQLQEELDELKSDIGEDVSDPDIFDRKSTEAREKARRKKVELMQAQRVMDQMERAVEDGKDSLDKPFPDGYEVEL